MAFGIAMDAPTINPDAKVPESKVMDDAKDAVLTAVAQVASTVTGAATTTVEVVSDSTVGTGVAGVASAAAEGVKKLVMGSGHDARTPGIEPQGNPGTGDLGSYAACGPTYFDAPLEADPVIAGDKGKAEEETSKKEVDKKENEKKDNNDEKNDGNGSSPFGDTVLL
jgi:hypothetical protein